MTHNAALRSIATALFADTSTEALQQLWAFIVFPLIGGAVGAVIHRALHSADACAVIQRMCSGTSVPGPRTSRTTSPCFTVSMTTAALCTVGTAGSSRVRATVTSTTPVIAAPMMICRL